MKTLVFSVCSALAALSLFAAKVDLADGWEFRREGGEWERVSVPHDWAIRGPFDREIDKQVIRIVQDQEKKATVKTGRTGALPWLGRGEYRRKLAWPKGAKSARLYFHGAMSEPEVFLDGEKIGEWKLGYAPFSVELKPFEGERELTVRCFNRPLSSRWYPGAGLYRPVELKWDEAVRPEDVQIVKEGVRDGKAVMRVISPLGERTFEIENPVAWSPETPHLYTLEPEGIRYGVRDIEYGPDFFKLNGVKRKFKGACMHHDLGPFGAAFDEWAFRRQVTLLKDMGCDSIRTSHNIPEERMLDICDEMGMMVLVEAFDAWELPKVQNGYNLFYKDWWKRDLEAMVRMARNHPCVVMWSTGNEVPDQAIPRGAELVKTMQDFIHSLDAEKTRLVSMGASQMPKAIDSGVIAAMEIPAVTYRLPFYEAIHAVDPKKPMLGIETASTVSSRGIYKFPVDEHAKCRTYADGHCSGYDTECCIWSNLPDDDWAMQEDRAWTIGEFIWTGFDYLGEPTPYNEYWPSRSSYFGAYDLAGLPKDRVWLYRSHWNTKDHTVKLCPAYWNFPGREGQVVPVYVYTDGVSAELFLNGRSLGRRTKDPSSRLDRFRLRWTDVVYEPGELRVVAYDAKGAQIGADVLRTAGPFKKFKEEPRDFGPYRFVTVSAVDADGNLCPDYDGSYEVCPPVGWKFKCICNGDQTSLELFHVPHMKLFRGQLVYVLKRSPAPAVPVKYAAEDASREERFANPPARSRFLPIRNERPNDLAKVEAEMKRLKGEGFGGLTCSVNRDTNYLHNAASWKTFRHVVEQAHSLGMAVWLYDEKGYPSGSAGGETLKGHPEWQPRAYLVTVTNAPDGKVVVADVKDEFINEGTNVDIKSSRPKYPYPNLLMRRPLERFIEVTHEAYARELGPALRYIDSTFTDEPGLMTIWWKKMPYLCLPVSDEFLAAYEAKFGHPLMDDVPALVTGEPVGETAAIRHRYWSMVAKMAAENYSGRISEWTSRNGIGSGGHLLAEESLTAHVPVYGDFFRMLRGFTAPGCDMLTSVPSEVPVVTPLMAGSAGELNGSKRVMSEASDYFQRRNKAGRDKNRAKDLQVTARQIVGSINRQIWGGVNTFTSYYHWNAFSTAEKRAINLEVGRTVTLATEGRSAAEVAVLYPADTLMIGFEPQHKDSGGALAKRTSGVFTDAVNSLFAAGRAIMVTDADSLASAKVASDGELVCGSLRWRTVVLPNAVVLPIAAARKLASFEALGGQVIVFGEEPVNSDKAFPDAELAKLVANWTRVKSGESLAKTIAVRHPAKIAVASGPEGVLRFSHRRTEKDGDIFFVANDSVSSWKGTVRISGDPAVRVWDPRTGRTREAKGEIALELWPYAAAVLTTSSVVYAPESASREERFANPPARSRILPIRLARPNDFALADAELAMLKADGFGGLAGSVNRDTNYLHNAESWKTFRHVVEQAHSLGMSMWLYDEKGYPSGAAGGQVLEGHPEWRARAYLVSVTNAPDGKVVVTDVKDDYIFEGTHLSVSVSQFKFAYPNLLMREPTDRFIELTHDAYARELGDALKYITSTFTDEPSLMTHWRKPMPYLCLPVSDEFLAAYVAQCGHPLRDDIPALITGEPVGEIAAIRHRFWSMVAARLADNYTRPLADWATKHGILSGGHLLGEESPFVHPTIYGDFFRVLRGLTAPGCDVLTSDPPTVDPLTPLFAGSAAELNGAKFVMSEASDYQQRRYRGKDACKNVQVTARQIVGSLNRQIWGGVNTFTSYYRWGAFSTAERFAINEEIGRTLTLTSEGRSAAEVAVLYPADTLMTGFEPKCFRTGGELAERTSDAFVNSVRTLFAAGRAIMIVDAKSIAEAEVKEGALVAGPLRWRTVVLPNAATLPIAVARKLAAFEAAGGQVVVLGDAPVNSEKAFPDSELAGLVAKWTRVKSVKSLAKTIAERHAPTIAAVSGPKGVLRFAHRRTEKDGDIFFVANDSASSWKGAVRIAGDPAVRVWDPRTGRTREAKGEIALELPQYAAVVLTTSF